VPCTPTTWYRRGQPTAGSTAAYRSGTSREAPPPAARRTAPYTSPSRYQRHEVRDRRQARPRRGRAPGRPPPGRVDRQRSARPRYGRSRPRRPDDAQADTTSSEVPGQPQPAAPIAPVIRAHPGYPREASRRERPPDGARSYSAPRSRRARGRTQPAAPPRGDADAEADPEPGSDAGRRNRRRAPARRRTDGKSGALAVLVRTPRGVKSTQRSLRRPVPAPPVPPDPRPAVPSGAGAPVR